MKATRARRLLALLAILASGYLTLATSYCGYDYDVQVELEIEGTQAPTTMIASARSDYAVLSWSVRAPAGATLSYLDVELPSSSLLATHTVDPTDLFTSPSLLVARWLGRRQCL